MTTIEPVRTLPPLGPNRRTGRYSRPTLEYRSLLALQFRGLLPDGEFHPGDGTSQDLRLGLDWTLLQPDGTGFGIGIHVGLREEHGTFSLRTHTATGSISELMKRRMSIEHGGTYPAYTVHAYAQAATGIVEQAYLAATKTLYRHVMPRCPADEHDVVELCSCAVTNRNPDGSRYVAVAITEAARTRLGVKSALPGTGVAVRILYPDKVEIGQGLGL